MTFYMPYPVGKTLGCNSDYFVRFFLHIFSSFSVISLFTSIAPFHLNANSCYIYFLNNVLALLWIFLALMHISFAFIIAPIHSALIFPSSYHACKIFPPSPTLSITILFKIKLKNLKIEVAKIGWWGLY